MKLTQLKVGDIVVHKEKLCSILAIVRAPFSLGPNQDAKLGTFIKLCPIRTFEHDRFSKAKSDVEYDGIPHIRLLGKKYCTKVVFDEGEESPEIGALEITIPEI